MIEVRNSKNIKPYITKDKSEIKEIFHPNNSEIKTMSLAEATVYPGDITEYHYHEKSDEIYFILQGTGTLEIEGEKKKVRENDCILISSKGKHRIKNIGKVPLKILCFSIPPYSHEQTILVESTQ
jgi:mannose-6-phosphate isomerase-like protein (cupin superfamily)